MLNIYTFYILFVYEVNELISFNLQHKCSEKAKIVGRIIIIYGNKEVTTQFFNVTKSEVNELNLGRFNLIGSKPRKIYSAIYTISSLFATLIKRIFTAFITIY